MPYQFTDDQSFCIRKNVSGSKYIFTNLKKKKERKNNEKKRNQNCCEEKD